MAERLKHFVGKMAAGEPRNVTSLDPMSHFPSRGKIVMFLQLPAPLAVSFGDRAYG